jgi:hypothetical protein
MAHLVPLPGQPAFQQKQQCVGQRLQVISPAGCASKMCMHTGVSDCASAQEQHLGTMMYADKTMIQLYLMQVNCDAHTIRGWSPEPRLMNGIPEHIWSLIIFYMCCAYTVFPPGGCKTTYRFQSWQVLHVHPATAAERKMNRYLGPDLQGTASFHSLCLPVQAKSSLA